MDTFSFLAGLGIGSGFLFGLWWHDNWRKAKAEAVAKVKTKVEEGPKTATHEFWYWLTPDQMIVMRDQLSYWMRAEGHGIQGDMEVTFRVLYEDKGFKSGLGSWWKVCLRYSDAQGRDLVLQKLRSLYHHGLSCGPGPWCADPKPAPREAG